MKDRGYIANSRLKEDLGINTPPQKDYILSDYVIVFLSDHIRNCRNWKDILLVMRSCVH